MICSVNKLHASRKNMLSNIVTGAFSLEHFTSHHSSLAPLVYGFCMVIWTTGLHIKTDLLKKGICLVFLEFC